MIGIKDLIYIVIFVYLFCLVRSKNKEKMSNTKDDIRDIVNEVYKADVEAIRNLSDIADKLQGKGKYKNKEIVLPGNLTIQGNLKVNKNSTTVGSITGKSISGKSISGKSISGSSITGKKIKGSSITGGELNVSGNAKVNSFEVQGDSKFGTNSNRRLDIVSSNYSNGCTYLSFYDENGRMGYLQPNKSKNLELVDMKFLASNVLKKDTKYKIANGCHKLIYTDRINSSNPYMNVGKCGRKYAGFDTSGDTFTIS